MKTYKTWSAVWFLIAIFSAYHDIDVFAASALVCSTVWVAAGTLRRDIK